MMSRLAWVKAKPKRSGVRIELCMWYDFLSQAYNY